MLNNILVLSPAAAPVPATVIRVTDAAGLSAALSAAQGGETILLADGDYGAMTMTAQYGAPVTIRSENPQGARFTGLDVQNAANLTLDGLLLDFEATPGKAEWHNHFSVISSRDITIRNSLFDGDDMDTPGDPGDGYPSGVGLQVTGTENVLIENNEFRTFWKALKTGANTNLTLRGNDIHDIRSDGINIVSSSYVTVEENYIHDFRSNLGTGDHPDMIQMWSGASAVVPNNITIRNNWLDRGSGAGAQAIFLEHNAQSRSVHGDDIAFQNITVTGNVIINGHVNGITLGTTHGAVVANNTLIIPLDVTGSAPRISIDPLSTGVALTDNIAPNFATWTAFPAEWNISGNVAIQKDAPGQPNHYSDIFVNAMSGVSHAPENLTMVPDHPVTLAGAGSPLLRFDPTPQTLTALVRPEAGAFANDIVFDGSYSAGPDGLAGQDHARFVWDFGDGTTGTGETATHRYTAPGVYAAVLTVSLPDGTADTTTILSKIAGPDLILFDPADGDLLWNDFGTLQPCDTGMARATDNTLAFAADTMIVLPDGAAAAMTGASDLEIDLSLQATAQGTVIGCKGVFSLQITGSGELSVYMPGLAGGNAVTSGAHLLDGGLHDIDVHFDGDTRSLTVTVDDTTQVAVLSALATLPDDIVSVIKLGAAKSGSGFTGIISALDIDVNADDYDMTAPSAAAAAFRQPSGRLEIGTLSVSQATRNQWHSVSFDEAITDARVVMGPISANSDRPAVTRVRNVTDAGFEFQIDEWDYLTGKHGVETVSWMAASAGMHHLADGRMITVGRLDARDTAISGATFDAFDAAPTVLSQVSSANGRQAVTSRVLDSWADGFELRLQEEEAHDGRHLSETVDWIALEGGSAVRLDHRWQGVAASADAALFAAMQTAQDPDPAGLRFRAGPDGTLALRIEEETSADAEIQHGIEIVHLLSMVTGGYDLFA